MSWTKPYARIKSGIVAIIKKFEDEQGEFPTILGTGFLTSTEGVVCTCKHVADAIVDLPKPEGAIGYAARALLFVETGTKEERGWAFLVLEIPFIGYATVFGNTQGYVGPNPPDVAYLLLEARETPAVEVSDERLEEGEMVAFAGFPMGRELLQAPGWLHQVSPTLHTGVVAAVLPHNHVRKPHAFLVHANTQGGASGSPVFREDGKVAGMVYSVAQESYSLGGGNDDDGYMRYAVPTSLTCCVSREILAEVLPHVNRDAAAMRDRKTLNEIIAAGPKTVLPGQKIFEPWKPPGSKA